MNILPNQGQGKMLRNSSGGIIIWLLVGTLLVMLIGGGVALAAYLGFIQLDGIADKARKIPIVSKYILKEAVSPQEEQVVVPMEAEPPTAVEVKPAQKASLPLTASPPVPKEIMNEQLEKIKADELKNITRLARLYGSMKPEEAVPILTELNDAFVVSLLRKMEDEQAARILTGMEPKRAAKLTLLLSNAISKSQGQSQSQSQGQGQGQGQSTQ